MSLMHQNAEIINADIRTNLPVLSDNVWDGIKHDTNEARRFLQISV